MRSLSRRSRRPGLALLLLFLSLSSAARGATPAYRTFNATEYGKVLGVERSDARTLRAALQLTLADLTRYFRAPPSVYSAFADSKDPLSGGATFLVTAKGVKMKGLVTCKVGEPTTKVAVVYIRADATAAQWAQLVSPPPDASAKASPGPAPSGTTAAASTAVGAVPLQTYGFPDGTGSVGLAEGWTTNAQTGTRAALLLGPKDQAVSIGGMYTVQTPSSRLPLYPGALVAPFGSAIEVFTALVPQFSQLSAKQGGPTRTIDHLVKVDDPKHVLASAQLSVLRYGVTETSPSGGSKHYQGMAWVGLVPMKNGTFLVTLTQMRAPDETFEKDKPVMFEMLTSVKTNDAAIQRKSSQELAAQKQRFDAQQKAMRAQQAANDAQHKQYWDTQAANEAQHKQYWDSQREQARRNDNFDEYIRGVRTVEDTQTGIKTSVDLGNVDKIVDDLNERDPGRFKEIPLRDEAHPLPGH
jgi:hypothetical protein